MKINQKLILYHLGIFLLFSIACKNQNKIPEASETANQTQALDTLRLQEIEETLNRINEAVQIQGYPTTIPFPIYNPMDTLKYWNMDGKPARISVNLIYPDRNVWPTFFLQDGELIFIRTRLWVKTPPAYAMESMIYLNGDEIIYCTSRQMDLKEGEPPMVLRDKEFSICSRPDAEMKKDYEEYWKTIKGFLDKSTGSQN